MAQRAAFAFTLAGTPDRPRPARLPGDNPARRCSGAHRALITTARRPLSHEQVTLAELD